MRVVVDTNVFISGIFWETSYCNHIIKAWKEGKFTLITSVDIINELIRILNDFKIELEQEIISGWKNIIIENAEIVESNKKFDIVKEHQSDNKFFEAAIAGNADIIISQDKHLLKIKKYQGIKVLTPEEFLKTHRMLNV